LKKNQLNQGDLSVLQAIFTSVVAHHPATTALLRSCEANRC
jgi:hypothetical protein